MLFKKPKVRGQEVSVFLVHFNSLQFSNIDFTIFVTANIFFGCLWIQLNSMIEKLSRK